MKRKILAAAFAGMIAAVSVQLPATAAPAWEERFASGDHSTREGVCDASGVYAYGCFNGDGDWFSVKDTASDGYSAAIIWWNYTVSDKSLYRRGACVEKRGEGSFGGCNMNFHEGSVVEFQVCRYEAGASGVVPDKVYSCNLAVGLREMVIA